MRYRNPQDLARKMSEFEDVCEDVTRLTRVTGGLGQLNRKELEVAARKLDK